MAWIVGVDEAGYGPNLGPFVMTSVACRVPDSHANANLWPLLHSVVRRATESDDGRILLDDSKQVYVKRGIAGLERGILPLLANAKQTKPATLAVLLERICLHNDEELQRETWYRGSQTLPLHLEMDEWQVAAERLAEACADAGIGDWQFRAVVVCPPRFNALLDQFGSKGCVLSDSLSRLLRGLRDTLRGNDAVAIFIDKHGGRNAYAAILQHALPDGVVLTERESMECSSYRLHGLGRDLRLTFQPRADAEHLCVALASMASKYLRELMMLEFNRFWREQVPDLKPTAGYPVDAARFMQAIRTTIDRLGLSEESIWRRK
jgi:ribonuclease HII